tara:strand:- start:1134 stop:2093 length:960 start_codon:yes stop_codon:yes gene_type:complete
MQKQKRITLNADKRKVIADVFQDHFESNSKYKKAWQDAKENYDLLRKVAKEKIERLVRFHQPQEDVDTIRSMINKYGESGGRLYDDNCFHVQTDTPRMDTDYNDNPIEKYDDVHVEFKADKEFLTAYYRDEMKAKGIDADYDVRLGDNYDKRNPTYYNSESAVNKYLGYGSRNDVSGKAEYQKDKWENDFKLIVIGTSYCHDRMFQTNHNEYLWFKNFNVAKDNLILAHKNLFDHVDKKMQKLKLGLKSYRYFDQAKELADKLGVVLNESILDAHSSMALSIYSPTNLADLLTDEIEQTREEKIAIAKKLLLEQQNSLN